jgi:hypothetical protein
MKGLGEKIEDSILV